MAAVEKSRHSCGPWRLFPDVCVEEEGELDILPKQEAAALRKEKEKLSKNLAGIKEMRKIPNAIFVVDPNIEHNAVMEARKLKIPVFGLIDTNSNPDDVDYINNESKKVNLMLAGSKSKPFIVDFCIIRLTS